MSKLIKEKVEVEIDVGKSEQLDIISERLDKHEQASKILNLINLQGHTLNKFKGSKLEQDLEEAIVYNESKLDELAEEYNQPIGGTMIDFLLRLVGLKKTERLTPAELASKLNATFRHLKAKFGVKAYTLNFIGRFDGTVSVQLKDGARTFKNLPGIKRGVSLIKAIKQVKEDIEALGSMTM